MKTVNLIKKDTQQIIAVYTNVLEFTSTSVTTLVDGNTGISYCADDEEYVNAEQE